MNEFNIKNGFISNNNSIVQGGLTATIVDVRLLFKRALELNPENGNSKRMLEQIKTKG